MTLCVAQIIGSLKVGGAERHYVSLANALPQDKVVAIFLGDRPQTVPTFYDQLDAAVERHSLSFRFRFFPFQVLRLAMLLRSSGCNVVHTHMFWATFYGALAARIAGVPVVVSTEHGENRWKKPIHRWVEKHVISRLVDLRFCVSRRILAQRRDRDGVPAEQLRLISNGTAVCENALARPRGEWTVVGSVGRFVKAKDFPSLVRAVADVHNRGHRVKLCIVGDGPEMGAVKRAIAETGIEELVELPGYSADTNAWYRRFDIFASSSVEEGQPVALLEAMAHGLAIVATDVGAIGETVASGAEGLVVPSHDQTALADALERLVRDPHLAQQYGRAARSRLQKEFSITAIAEKYRSTYLDLLQRRRPTPSPVRE